MSRQLEMDLRAATAYSVLLQIQPTMRYSPFMPANCFRLSLTATIITFKHPNRLLRYSLSSISVGSLFSQLLMVSTSTSMPKNLQNWRTADMFYSSARGGVCNSDSRRSLQINLLSSMIRCETVKFGMILLVKNFTISVSRISTSKTVLLSSIRDQSIFRILVQASYSSIFYSSHFASTRTKAYTSPFQTNHNAILKKIANAPPYTWPF